MNYKETVGSIEKKFGHYAFVAALSELMNNGMKIMSDDSIVNETLKSIDESHDEAERNDEFIFISRDFEKAIVECEHEIAKCKAIDIMQYICYCMDFDWKEKSRKDMRKDVSDIFAMVHSEYGIDHARNLAYSCDFDEDDIEYYGINLEPYEDEM